MTAPSRDSKPRQAETLLAARIARRYYMDGISKSDIATEFGLSRFKVARTLDKARSSGLVRIELHYDGEMDLELSVELASHLGLTRCLVIDSPEGDESLLRANLGRVAAGLLEEITGPSDVLGLAWSRTLLAMRSALTSLAPCAVVQLTGALSRPDVDSSIEVVRDVAKISRGPAFYFYAPMIVPEAETAKSLRMQPEVAGAMAHYSNLTKAVIAVGAWAPRESTIVDALSAGEYERGRDSGVVGEVCGIQLDAEGRPVRTALSERLIGIGPDQLRATPEILMTAYGEAKANAVMAAVRGRFVTTLITHAALARELLRA
jgi:DNA-binding transcriptional regulator LsrR (DeoR family)